MELALGQIWHASNSFDSKVGDLIDPTNTWIIEKVQSHFDDFVAQQVLPIPLSKRARADDLIWRHHRHEVSEKWIVLCWSLWYGRNRLVFQEYRETYEAIWTKSRKYKQRLPRGNEVSYYNRPLWATDLQSAGSVSLGYVVRNRIGGIYASGTHCERMLCESTTAEAMALRFGPSSLNKLGMLIDDAKLKASFMEARPVTFNPRKGCHTLLPSQHYL
ncbi:hypothetical protein Ancab_003940 [Ancistrocladus abbreviatus]